MALRSLFSGVSGLRNHSLAIDVIGNNIANVNTVAYKYSRVTFEDAMSQTLRGASGGTDAGTGGTNPLQVGLGSNAASIDQILTQGALQRTDNDTDFAIEGNGYFILGDGTQNYYSRAGAFSVDEDGFLVNPANGMKLQGWMASGGVVTPGATVTDLQVPYSTIIPAKSTTDVTYQGNLDSTAAIGTSVDRTIEIWDSNGTSHVLTMNFQKTGANTWLMTASATDGAMTGANDTATLTFNANGSLAGIAYETGGQNYFEFTPTGGSAMQFTADVGTISDFDGVTQLGSTTNVVARDQDGYGGGSLESFSVGADGVITGTFSNGERLSIAQIALANFNNPSGLSRGGENMYSVTPNSGIAQIGPPDQGSLGAINQGTLEASNVDLALEFTNMIIMQRGFQSNARVITTADNLLGELVNLKR